MELVNECLPTGNFRKVYTPFSTNSKYEKELMAALPLIGHALNKEEMEYHGKFGRTLGQIQHISIMSINDICYTTGCLENQTVAYNLPGFQVINRCVQYG